MISSIEQKLTEKSQSSPDQGLRFMFLMNNLYVMQQLLRHSASEFVLESHMQILTNKIDDYMRDYLEASWAPVLSCLYCTAPPRLGRDSPFDKFKKEFQKTYSTQKLWPVRNPELRKKLRNTITDKVISGMTKYLVDNTTTIRQRVELTVEVEEMEKMLQEIFEG
ncbi:hypothetical protein HU200_040552 [Digitaria exilis]|uniref:Exocyst subunit Exo70 family protein n=1 Tax=Digitaria exilis TaxID=1010633 RepID=A0A835B906_9POAL|nr:hypothetical protein HU200_040552 [Digitaria exilis]